MVQLNIPTKKDLKVMPKDTIIDGVVVNLEVMTWKEITKDPEKAKKLKNPEEKVLKVTYDSNGFIRTDSFPFSINPTTMSKYGRYIEKYGDFVVGQKVKVQFDGEGKSEIVIPKK